MTRQSISRSFYFLTPAFPHGVYQSNQYNQPELRAPSLRGQLRWWWRALSKENEDPLGNRLFGNAAGKEGSSSKIQLRLQAPLHPETTLSEILPHKSNPRDRGSKKALNDQGDEFTLELRPRREGISEPTHERLARVFDSWLLMGGVGQRANRAAGSPWPSCDAPESPVEYLDQCRRLLTGSALRIALLNFTSDDPMDLRKIAGRFPNPKQEQINPEHEQILGIVFGSAKPRKPSPLRLRAVQFDNTLHLAALWAPSGPEDTLDNLKKGVSIMRGLDTKRELGALLEKALPDLRC